MLKLSAKPATLLLLALFAFHGAPRSAMASERHALIISTANYAQARNLRNPHADGQAVAEHLRSTGFQLFRGQTHQDLTRAELIALMRDFASDIPDNALAVVFIAGHGLTQQGQTFLIPADDQNLMSRADLPRYGVALQTVSSRLAGRRGVETIIFVDACSANALLGASDQDTGRVGDVITPTDGSLSIIYAAAPGQIAADGDGDNSPFTQSLLSVFGSGQSRIDDVFYALSQDLRAHTQGAQTPWMVSILAHNPQSGPSLPPMLFP